ncbi:MAG: hypothetical protein NT031_12275, partial [Planctomycetota bacterium]|nr:hypothetical protein [Planctomycetota bacterium]
MIHPRAGWLILAAAAALPLAGAEPDLDMRTKTRDLYMKYTQAPAGQDSPALKAAAEELLDLTARRAESRPAAPTTAPASRPAPIDLVAQAAPASQPARHELDPAAIKALATATGT